ncbi:10 kDa heat shock protein, mitochondrial-like [Anneissia japonica]|uniref:10 kDa heat shock protein, mitochondrial-like n=1 Tax=Anneissia japonica TaxID=1529436 RepID=UPI0014256FD6|nr:10 kDa heat shock protein, mitochondrial-like [Anneissia japonica]
MAALKNFRPLFDRVLVERFLPELKTKGGIMLPQKGQAKVLDATVVATGPGARMDDGKRQELCVAVGDRVLLPEYGGTKISIDDKEYHLFREGDILAKYDS